MRRQKTTEQEAEELVQEMEKAIRQATEKQSW